MTTITRRGTLAVAFSLPVLAACGGDDSGGDDTNAARETPSQTPSETPSEMPSQTPGQTPSQPPAAPTTQALEPGIVAVSEVPVGGGVVLADAGVVVTQPQRGQFRGFTATCTHMGCTLASVTSTINCNCHGSKFEITDGSVANGPASKPLGEKPVRVDGDQIRLA